MSRTVFDLEVRTLECASCGAPIEAPKEGGQARCNYCSRTNLVVSRAADERARLRPSRVEEVARLSRLNSQLANPVSGHFYDLNRPPLDFERVDLSLSAGLTKLRASWEQARASAPATPGSEDERRVCWMAIRLAERYVGDRDAIHARAVLETALDRVSDAGLCNLIRCRLASAATRAGDLGSAQGWLDECDAAPELLELDSAYREAIARLRAAEGNPGAVIEVLGRRSGDVPIHRAVDLATVLLRIDALEASGATEAAGEEFDNASGRYGAKALVAALAAQNLAPGVRAREAKREAKRAQAAAAALALEAQQDAARDRAHMNALARQRAELKTGIAALPAALVKVPVIALALLILVAIPRCSFNVDPLMGVQGYALCPEACQGCEGPMWVFTEWTQTGPGEYSSDGAEYYCMSPPAPGETESKQIRHANYQMSWVAAVASSYGILVLLALILVPPMAMITHSHEARRRQKLDEEIQEIQRRVGGVPEAAKGRPVAPLLILALGFIGAALGLAALVTFVAL
ncbi:MAG: hypothetical protein R3B13_11705 [Polyangiaceae bacterium]